MVDKSAASVLKALQAHIAKVGIINELTSDEDSAYLSAEVQNFMLQNHINHITTEENNHHILGIVNRFIKTLRDLNQDRDISDQSMNSIIEEYNSSKHSSIHKSPNNFNKEDEVNWINKKVNETHAKESHGIPEGSMVKVLNEGTFTKKTKEL
jgi:transposase InsO family protein